MKRHTPGSCAVAFLLCIGILSATAQSRPSEAGWPTYGGDPGGQRYSQARQIDPSNVSRLVKAWDFDFGAANPPTNIADGASLETTPVLRDGVLFASSAYDDVYALSADTGKQIWHFDPHVKTVKYQIVTSRGVALWPLTTETIDHKHPCATRVFIGTLDARLLAIDAATGLRCEDFGTHGQVDLTQGLDSLDVPGYSVTSPPTVIGNVVIVGSRIGDNQQATAEDGVVRGFDAITGHLIWSWEPIPWRSGTHPRLGAANVWSVISADPTLGLVFLPTSAPSLDYYGAGRPGDNRDANSVVALDGATGRRVWAFQTVHHDLWDYDIPSEPLLFTFQDGTPALLVTTKTGQVFVLDRRNGKPLIPVEERPVPQSTIPGEHSWPTQPFSQLPMLSDLAVNSPEANGSGFIRSASNADLCQQQLSSLSFEGIYTPPSAHGSLQFPGNLGGVNWGGAAFDPSSGTLYANVNRETVRIRLLDRNGWTVWWRINRGMILDWPMGIYVALAIIFFSGLIRGLWSVSQKSRKGWRRWLPSVPAAIVAAASTLVFAALSFLPQTENDPHFGYEISEQLGSPYYLERSPVYDNDHHSCASPPWGALVALNLNTRSISFRSALGTSIPGEHTGALAFGGPIVTAGGLVFDAGTSDKKLRAFASNTGKELWSASLPAAGRATPITYSIHDRQYVVIAAGGHGGLNEPLASHLVAYALP